MSNYNVQNTSVSILLGWIEEGIVAIPEIQRPFVWNASKVRDLLDSLYKDYPIGYIITWQNPDARLKDGSISQGKRILIDGQQRITALMAAISGYKVINKKYQKKHIKIAFNPIEEKFEVQNNAILKNKKWIPDISKLFDTSFGILQFINDYCKENPEIGLEELNKIIQRLINIKNSTLGIIELNHTLDIETVTEIFIRINSAGVSLSQADFAMSKISVNDKYNGPIIRKIIDYFSNIIKDPIMLESVRENDQEFSSSPAFNKINWLENYNESIYEPSYVDVLRVAFTYKFLRGRLSNLVSLLSGRDFETREYKEAIIEESFSKLNEGVLQFVNETNFKRFLLIVKSAGIINSKLVRSKSTLNFAYALYLLLKEKGVNGATINHVVRKWLIASILTSRYSSSPESTFDFDIKRFNQAENPVEYLEAMEKSDLSEAYWENTLVESLETSVISSPYFNLYLMAQINDKSSAFLSKSINVQQLIEERGDVHHVFPKNYLQKNGYNNYRYYNQIANYAYTEQTVNLAIKDKSPKEYLSIIHNQIKNNKLEIGELNDVEELNSNFKENCIPESIHTMDYKEYTSFLMERRKLMRDKIKNYYENL